MKRLFSHFPVRLAIVVIFTLLTGWVAFSGNVVGAILFGLADLCAMWFLYRLFRLNLRRVHFLLEAVENNDFNFKFTPQARWGSDRWVTESLNKITEVLSAIRNDEIEKERYFEVIMHNVTTGIVAFDEQGFVSQANPAALKMFGISVLTHIGQLQRVQPTLPETLLSAQKDERMQISISNERGSKQLSLQFAQVSLKGKQLKLVAINDIRNELDDKEIESWSTLTRVLTHEIMNSMAPVVALSDNLQSRLQNEDASVRLGLETISTTGKGLMRFVESYRKFTHLPTPEPTLFYVLPFLQSQVRLLENQSENSRISFEIKVKPSDMLVYADENLIGQVIGNILKNAAQAVANVPAGHIVINSYLSEKEAVIIEISNNGVPISPELVERIFVPFFTTKEDGSGIGLSISRQIMRLSGGTLTLRTEPMTTFVLSFS